MANYCSIKVTRGTTPPEINSYCETCTILTMLDSSNVLTVKYFTDLVGIDIVREQYSSDWLTTPDLVELFTDAEKLHKFCVKEFEDFDYVTFRDDKGNNVAFDEADFANIICSYYIGNIVREIIAARNIRRQQLRGIYFV